MGRTRPPASSAPLSRTLPKRARLSTTRFDTAAIASAPQQQHDPIRHKASRKPKPKPKPAARQSVKTQAGISRDSGGTTTTGQSTALRAKVLAAVVRLSREKKRGQRGVGHSSVNTYLASHAPPPSAGAMITSFATLVLEAKHQLLEDGILLQGKGSGNTLAVASGVSEDVQKLYSVSEPNSSEDERACTTFLSSTGRQRRPSSSKPALKPSGSCSLQPEVVIPPRSSTPSSSRRSGHSTKKRRASMTSHDGHGTSDLDTLTESDSLLTPTRSRKGEPTPTTSRTRRQKKKVRIVTPSEEDGADGGSSTDAQGESDVEHDGDVESDAEIVAGSSASAARKGKAPARSSGASGSLGRLTKLQLVAVVEQLRGQVKVRDDELDEAREQLEALAEVGRTWEARARALGWEGELLEKGAGTTEDGKGEAGAVAEEDEQEKPGEDADEDKLVGPAPGQEANSQPEPLSGLDSTALDILKPVTIDTELAGQPGSADDKVGLQSSSTTVTSTDKLAAAHDYDASIDADLLIDDDAFDAELRRAGWGTPSVPAAAAAAASSHSSSTEPSPPAPRPDAGAPFPSLVLKKTAPEPRRGASAPPAPPAPSTPPSAREQARLTMQTGATTTAMAVLVDSSASHALTERTSVEPEKAAVVPRRSSLPTDAVLRGSPGASPHKAPVPADIFARFGGERASSAASSSSSTSAAQVEKGLVRGGSGGEASAARMKELETERDEAEARKKELEGELQKARAESAALEEDVGGILSRHHEIVIELSMKKLQLEATVAALDLKLANLELCLVLEQHEREQQREDLSTLESNRDTIASLVLRHGVHHAQQAGAPIAWPTPATLPHAQLVAVLESLMVRLHARGDEVTRLERERTSCASLVAGVLHSCHNVVGVDMSASSNALTGGGGAEGGGTKFEAALQLVVHVIEQLVANLGSARALHEQSSLQITEHSSLAAAHNETFVRLANTLATSLGSTQSVFAPAPEHRRAFIDYVVRLADLLSQRYEASQRQVAEQDNELRTAKAALEKVEAQLQVETSRTAELVAEKDKISARVVELEGVSKSFIATLAQVGLMSSTSASSAARLGEESSQA